MKALVFLHCDGCGIKLAEYLMDTAYEWNSLGADLQQALLTHRLDCKSPYRDRGQTNADR